MQCWALGWACVALGHMAFSFLRCRWAGLRRVRVAVGGVRRLRVRDGRRAGVWTPDTIVYPIASIVQEKRDLFVCVFGTCIHSSIHSIASGSSRASARGGGVKK